MKRKQKSILKDFFEVLSKHRIDSTKALFNAIDNAFYATTLQNKNKPVSGTLIGGTFWHILNSLFIALMHIQKDNKDKIYKNAITKAKKICFEQYAELEHNLLINLVLHIRRATNSKVCRLFFGL